MQHAIPGDLLVITENLLVYAVRIRRKASTIIQSRPLSSTCVKTLALSSFVAASGFTRPLARFSTRLRSLTREMDTFLIIGICFLCYEMCDLIMRYAAPQAPIETHHAAETATATTKASSSQKVYSISRKIQGPPACCPQ
ncbi:hypothetical protein DMN91_005317 [Ooceraea biroi]|uniref:Uncharacterized protein n=1 Tax=Ooceraea biroi TaxID=2015173 RepID=A0A3L8DT20_OOCBI|nr:hypothetical protein DMN91_005317 [Ooceraea biroi]